MTLLSRLPHATYLLFLLLLLLLFLLALDSSVPVLAVA